MMQTTTATDADVRAAILAELTDDLQPWAAVRRRIPGEDQRKAAVLTEMFERHEVSAVKVRGANYVRAASDWDRAAAAAERDRLARTRPRSVPVSRCRGFVAL